MENPIPTYGWVHTPEGFGIIQDLIKGSGDPANATLVMLMTINLCHKMVEDRLTDEIPNRDTYGPEMVQPV